MVNVNVWIAETTFASSVDSINFKLVTLAAVIVIHSDMEGVGRIDCHASLLGCLPSPWIALWSNSGDPQDICVHRPKDGSIVGPCDIELVVPGQCAANYFWLVRYMSW